MRTPPHFFRTDRVLHLIVYSARVYSADDRNWHETFVRAEITPCYLFERGDASRGQKSEVGARVLARGRAR